MARLFGDAREELLFGILTRALKQKRFSRTLAPIPLQAWMDAVGPSLSARTRPTALARGILHVAVVDHRWRDQIDAARALILRRLNARLGPDDTILLEGGDKAPRIKFFLTADEALGAQFEGKGEGAEQIGVALLYVRPEVRAHSEDLLEDVENCLADL